MQMTYFFVTIKPGHSSHSTAYLWMLKPSVTADTFYSHLFTEASADLSFVPLTEMTDLVYYNP